MIFRGLFGGACPLCVDIYVTTIGFRNWHSHSQRPNGSRLNRNYTVIPLLAPRVLLSQTNTVSEGFSKRTKVLVWATKPKGKVMVPILTQFVSEYQKQIHCYLLLNKWNFILNASKGLFKIAILFRNSSVSEEKKNYPTKIGRDGLASPSPLLMATVGSQSPLKMFGLRQLKMYHVSKRVRIPNELPSRIMCCLQQRSQYFPV